MSTIAIEIKVHEVDDRYHEVRLPNIFAVAITDSTPIPTQFETYYPVRINSPFGPRKIYVRKDDQWFVDVLLNVASKIARENAMDLRREAGLTVLRWCDEEMGTRFGDSAEAVVEEALRNE